MNAENSELGPSGALDLSFIYFETYFTAAFSASQGLIQQCNHEKPSSVQLRPRPPVLRSTPWRSLDPLAMCPMLPYNSSSLISIKRYRIKEDNGRRKNEAVKTGCVCSFTILLFALLHGTG